MVRWLHLPVFALSLLTLLVSPLAHASSISFTGTFSHDTDLAHFTFTLLNPTPNVALRTWSYSDGTNAAGQVISSGGFEPYLNLYMADGTQMNPGSSGPCTVPPTGNPISDLLPDATTGACGDVFYPTTQAFPGGVWAAGTYIVVLSTFANPGIGNLSDGFFADQVLGLPVPSNFTCQVGPLGVQGNPPTIPTDQPFCDEFSPGVQRDGQWALDIINVDSATGPFPVPEPSTLALSLLGTPLFVARRRLLRK
jgi:hypothetical protein